MRFDANGKTLSSRSPWGRFPGCLPGGELLRRDRPEPRRFFDDFERSASRLKTFPLVGRVAFEPVRRVMLDHFPYFLYYVVCGQVVRVLALLYAAGDPQAREVTVRGRLASDSDE